MSAATPTFVSKFRIKPIRLLEVFDSMRVPIGHSGLTAEVVKGSVIGNQTDRFTVIGDRPLIVFLQNLSVAA